MKKLVFVLLNLLITAFAGSQALAAYTVTDLGLFRATDINNSGQVVGVSSASGYEHAFLYSSGKMQDLGTIGGVSSRALGINDYGQVVGYYFTASGGGNAFLYSNGNMQDLGNLGGVWGGAYGINNSGQIVGTSYTPNNSNLHAFLYNNGIMQDLGVFQATGINNSGQITGNDATSGNFHAVLYKDGVILDLGTLGGNTSFALGINDIGQVVGQSTTFPGALNSNAFIYSGGILHDLGTLGGKGSAAYDINNNGQVVGFYMTADSIQRAFLYSGGKMQDLNDLVSGSDWFFEEAKGINDNGQIIVNGYYLQGDRQTRAFLLTPTPVPLPSALLLFGPGLAGMIFLRRKATRF